MSVLPVAERPVPVMVESAACDVSECASSASWALFFEVADTTVSLRCCDWHKTGADDGTLRFNYGGRFLPGCLILALPIGDAS